MRFKVYFYKTVIILTYENAASKAVDMLFKSHQSQSDSAIFPIKYQLFAISELLTHVDLLDWVRFFLFQF